MSSAGRPTSCTAPARIGREHLAQRLSAEPLVDLVGEARKIVGVHVQPELETVLRGDTHRGDDDGQTCPRRQPDQLQMAEDLRFARRRHGEGDAVRKLAQQARGLLDHLF